MGRHLALTLETGYRAWVVKWLVGLSKEGCFQGRLAGGQVVGLGGTQKLQHEKESCGKELYIDFCRDVHQNPGCMV